jgi:LacI family transcriptional regulator
MSGTANRKGTLKGLARELDLSITTVSRALGGYSDVAPETRKRVLEAASRAEYVPNSAAKMLVTGRTGFVGFLLPLRDPAVLDPFLGEYITGLSEGLAERGRDLFMATVPSGQSELTVLQHVVESGRADAIVLTRIAEQDERVDYLMRRGFPFVTHGRTLSDDTAYSWIDSDGHRAFADLFNWLYGLGHRRFGLLSIAEPMTFRRHREDGLERAMLKQGDANVSLLVQHVPRFDVDARVAAVRRLLNDDHRPTAILALTDELGLCVIEQAVQLGIVVPEQLTVIGFDNIPASGFASPGLTTFDQSIRETARQIATMLLDSLDGESGTTQTLINAPLIKRGSHAPAPAIVSTVQGELVNEQTNIHH